MKKAWVGEKGEEKVKKGGLSDPHEKKATSAKPWNGPLRTGSQETRQ